MAGIYIHVPFCKQACSYCNFYFITNLQRIDEYVDSLVKEISLYKDTIFTEELIESIYIGGGTPSLLSIAQMVKIWEALHQVFSISPTAEITLEMNPDDVSSTFLHDRKDLGINRASMGVQSFDKDRLKFMHRAHTSEEAHEALCALKETDFPTFTVDLIYGNPGQTTLELLLDVEQLLRYSPPHLSAYTLTIEDRTRLGKQVELGRVPIPEEEHVIEQAKALITRLNEAGLRRYEVSNFAMKGKEAVHNGNYWNHSNYLGLGPGAHSFWWNEQKRSAKRWKHSSNLVEWQQQPNEQVEIELLNLFSLAEERLLIGLRTWEGIQEQELRARYAYEFSESQKARIESWIVKGWMQRSPNLHLTDEGLLFADALVFDLIST